MRTGDPSRILGLSNTPTKRLVVMLGFAKSTRSIPVAETFHGGLRGADPGPTHTALEHVPIL